MKPFGSTLLALAALLVVVPGAGAGTPGGGTLNGPPVVGPRLNLYPGYETTATFPAGTPFHLGNGFGTGPISAGNFGQVRSSPGAQEVMSGQTHVDFSLDGKNVPTFTNLFSESDGITKFSCANFRQGLPAGVHVFHIEFWDMGVLVLENTWPITFTS